MPYPQFDRSLVKMKPLAERRNKVLIPRDAVTLDRPPELSPVARELVGESVTRIRRALANGRPVMLSFGAHTIKNGLAPVLNELLERRWVTHLATNGAGVIHDWEIAFQGATSEDVRGGVSRGEFGNWRETGLYLNLALAVGAYEGMGYGESVGALIHHEGLSVPAAEQLATEARARLLDDPERAAAALDLLQIVRRLDLAPGRWEIPHPFRSWSVQAKAFAAGIPFTGHPMIGHDIIYNHPANLGAAIGRTAQRDFLTFAAAVGRIDGGVYLSIGSAVMSPMIFEKSMSMAYNLARQTSAPFGDHFIAVVDLAPSRWDWSQGEPPENNPDYYLRYNKSFSRLGGEMRYAQADNRDFLLALMQGLNAAGE
ncbi:MAG: hypothetical protein GX444_08385 [Myxococcales bacterium]|nr:hypothetical protein [Myxococcales bacterium]